MEKIIFSVFILISHLASSQDYGKTCNVDLNLECQRPPEYLAIVTQGSKWNPGSYDDRFALYNSTEVQNSIDDCNLFAMLLKTECGYMDPVNVIYHSDSENPVAISVVDGFEKDLPCKSSLTAPFKEYFNKSSKVFPGACPRSKKIVSDKKISTVISEIILGKVKK